MKTYKLEVIASKNSPYPSFDTEKEMSYKDAKTHKAFLLTEFPRGTKVKIVGFV